ncbi:hypothetical protein D9B87_07975 [Corynebacterium diphtheriae]|nr:hypothetical protein D9B42_08120 [Corynebacterium diphtheriae]RKW84649.1 hypothetical protein D9D07_08240 [Corynebacterium diphtheriae]RKW88145.1 hypothetical protein D9B87_07975 [Corynebacterium diphtheriae]UJL57879.1 hypothetical protein FE378_03850 [Corynebacterium diphtheriae]
MCYGPRRCLLLSIGPSQTLYGPDSVSFKKRQDFLPARFGHHLFFQVPPPWLRMPKRRALTRSVFVMPATGHDFVHLATAYSPRSISMGQWSQVQDYVVNVTVQQVVPTVTSREALRVAMLAIARTAVTALELGRPLTHEDVFDPDVIEYSVNTDSVSDRVKGTRRSVLISLGQTLNSQWPFSDTHIRYGYKAPDEPYTEAEVRQLRFWANSHSTDYQRDNARLLLGLGLGAGLRMCEMATLHAREVTTESGFVTVTASGFRGAGARRVPIRAEWEEEVAELIANLDLDHLALFPNRQQATTASVAAIISRVGKPATVQLDSRRLRTTWVVTLMNEQVPESVVATAAGLASLQHYKKWLSPRTVSEETARVLLRGGTPYKNSGLRLI